MCRGSTPDGRAAARKREENAPRGILSRLHGRGANTDCTSGQRQRGPWSRTTYLLGLDGGLTAVSSVVVAEGSVVDRVAVVVPLEGLRTRHIHFSGTVPRLGNG